MQFIESIPNFSEGTDTGTVEKILDDFRSADVKLVDYTFDSDYNRLVVTIIGEPEKVKAALLKASETAIGRIDMREHRGAHPRMGAVDVVPFVPLKNITMEECVDLSREFGKELSERHDLPVFLYDESATSLERRDIDFLRKGEFEGLKEHIQIVKPDFGPATPHPTAGATITGAREIMVGLNVNLSTSDLKVAKKIAKALHAKSGGLACVKAMACEFGEMTQIGMSNINYKKTPVYRQLELISIEARRYGIQVVSSEFCGLIPLDALLDVCKYYLKVDDLKEKRIIEMNL
ncbi:MAG: glutamate formimidoyltransferase [Theionarchaea archaeon]|nr:glutamate formimidoyltransferase [Theionarchaea archaeon]MBU7037612.1 glutamate formimidoyltransferase [Theionarchaea archaeon]